jgi:hypothetical protein
VAPVRQLGVRSSGPPSYVFSSTEHVVMGAEAEGEAVSGGCQRRPGGFIGTIIMPTPN